MFVVRFSVAVVLLVSMVAVQGCAVVMGFHAGLRQWLQRCHRFQSRDGWGPVREVVCPAYEKRPKIGGLWRAGRTLSCRARGCWRALVICRALRTHSRPWVLQAGPWVLRSRRASRETTEAGPRRIPPLVACGGRAVGAGKPALDHQCPSLSSVTTAAVASGANAQFFHQPLTVSTAWAPRSDSAEWALTRPEDRRAAWKREATFSQFTRFHQALT